MASLLSKMRTGARFFLNAETWRVALAESRHGRRSIGAPPTVEEVERDEAAGLCRLTIDGRDYWLPSSMDRAGLAEIHQEVFCPEHPHYYEYGGCRVRPGDVVVDAGASEGFFTRFALERGARVIAVEPWAPMAEALRRTFAAEIAEGRMIVEVTTLTDRSGEALLYYDPQAPWGAHVVAGGGVGRAGERGETVRQTTLDELVAHSPWGHCDFVKMDIEGDERAAVAGGQVTLRRDRPALSIAVYHHPTGYLDIRRDLADTGLDYRVTAKGLLRRRRGVSIPMILHAWPADRRAEPAETH